MSEPSSEFSRLFVAWFDRQPEWQRDQIQAFFREAAEVVTRLCDAVTAYEERGIAEAETHANGASE